MRGRIIVEQALGLGRVQIQPHTRDPFSQLVEHTFVEVRIHRLPWRNKLSRDHAARIKKRDQATAVFVVSETPGPFIPHYVVW